VINTGNVGKAFLLMVLLVLVNSVRIVAQSKGPQPQTGSIISSKIVQLRDPWCDGSELHVTKALVLTVSFGTIPPKEEQLREWDEKTGKPCKAEIPEWYKRIQAGEKPQSKHVMPTSDSKSHGEFCVCGWNTRTLCDRGGFVHYISNCYDEDQKYCGFDQSLPRLDHTICRP
jgi:hypothetical protein